MSLVRFTFMLVTILCAIAVHAAEDPRPWTTRTGEIKTATLYSYDGETLYLLPVGAKEDRLVSVKYDALSWEDQDYLDRRVEDLPEFPPYRNAMDTTARTWTATSGGTTNARLLFVSNTTLILLRGSSIYSVEVTAVSPEDRAYVQGRMEATGVGAATNTPINPNRPWRLKDSTVLNGGLRGYRIADQSLKFQVDGETLYLAFHDLHPDDQVTAYRYLQQYGADVSGLKPEGDMTVETVDLTTIATPAFKPPEKNTWTHMSGAARTANLVGVDGYNVILERDGRVFTIKISNLAVPDQEFLKRYHRYFGPIGNEDPAPGDAMKVDMKDHWGVTPGEFLDTRKLSPTESRVIFPETRIAGAEEETPSIDTMPDEPEDSGDDAGAADTEAAGTAASLGGTGDGEFDPSDYMDDDERALVEANEASIGELIAAGKKKLMVFVGILALIVVQMLVYAGSAFLCFVTAKKAKSDGALWFIGCMASAGIAALSAIVGSCAAFTPLGFLVNLVLMAIVGAVPGWYARFVTNDQKLRWILSGLGAVTVGCQFGIFTLKGVLMGG